MGERGGPLVSVGGAFAAPGARPQVLQEMGGERYRPMEGVEFAEAMELPAPSAARRRPMGAGFEESNVEAAAQPGPALEEGRRPPKKKAKAAPRPVPLRTGASGAPEPGSEEEEEYAGVFEGAEVIVSQQPAGAGPGAAGVVDPEGRGGGGDGDGGSSRGSELGSDLDDSEFDEPETDNVLFAEFARIRRSKRRWSVLLKHGVLRVNGVECLFSSAAGVFDMPAVEETVPVVREGAAAGLAQATSPALAAGDELEDASQLLPLPSPPPPPPPLVGRSVAETRAAAAAAAAPMGAPSPLVGADTPQLGLDTPMLGGDTPQIGGDTPQLGSETPYLGAETPRQEEGAVGGVPAEEGDPPDID
mmetsp:Transcript_86711/g.241313  ORF Transcript_86711/g.241313 Transcript_86711/m.241313 type:complete len:360 (-) Transcript_86711:101-1180(-)